MLTAAGASNAHCSASIKSETHRSGRQNPGSFARLSTTVMRRGMTRIAGSSLIGLALAAATMLSLSACSDPGKASLDSNVPLARAPELEGTVSPSALVWRSPDLAEHERAASSYLIPPATVYHGKGSSFGNLSPQEIDAIANDLTREVRAAIGHRFRIVNTPGPGVFTLQLILVKVTPPAPAYISNGPYDWSDAVIGMPDAQKTTAGMMVVSGKFIDSPSGKLLVGFVTPVSPQVMDMGSPSALGAAYRFAQLATQQFASDLVAAIVRQRQLNKVPIAQ